MYSTAHLLLAVVTCLLQTGLYLSLVEIKYRVVEESKVQSVIGNIHADIVRHSDLGSTKPEDFSYKPLTNIDPFYIEFEKHDLVVVKRVDRESICKSSSSSASSSNGIEYNIAAVQNCRMTFKVLQTKTYNDPNNFGTMFVVIIEILDINDNPPKWPNARVHFDLAEHSKLDTKLALPLAYDPDQSPMNTTKKYLITHQSVRDGFILKHGKSDSGQQQLWLMVNKDFDREVQQSINVKLDAYDGGPQPLSGHLDINISLADINDKVPRFTTVNPHRTIPENTPLRTRIFKLEAADEDESDRQSLNFQFDNSVDEAVRNRFYINPNTGEIFTAGYIDYESRAEYSIPVTVSDGKHLDRTTVTIVVENVNDNPPEITVMYVSGVKFETPRHSSQYRALVAENQRPGFVVATFLVSDKDHIPPPTSGGSRQQQRQQKQQQRQRQQLLQQHSGIECKIEANAKGDYLELRPLPDQLTDYFQIVTMRQFDREEQAQYFSKLLCYDTSGLSRTSSITLELTIVDVNDNEPIFKTPAAHSGSSSGRSAATSTGSYVVKEGAPIGTLIVRVVAYDRDVGVNANIEFSLDNMAAKYFSIDPLTGEIRSGLVFDYEKTQEFEVTVNASNPLISTGLISRVTNQSRTPLFTLQKLFISVEDINDCPPVFSQDLYSFEVKEGPSKDVLVGRVAVTDCDRSARFSTNFFRILPNSLSDRTRHIGGGSSINDNRDPDALDFFRVGETGFLYVRVAMLDRERHPSFSFRVQAADRSARPLSSTALVQVRLADLNDNPPVWLFPNGQRFAVNVSFQEPVGHCLTQLRASDPDSGDNGRIRYRIVAPVQTQRRLATTPVTSETSSSSRGAVMMVRHELFELDPANGNIYVAQKMSTKDLGSKALWLEASDQGSLPKKAYERLVVYIISSNLMKRDQKAGGSYSYGSKSSVASFGFGGSSSGGSKSGFENDLMIMIVLVAIIILVAMVMVIIILMLRCRNANRMAEHGKMVRDTSMSTNLTRSFMERRPDGHSCSPINEICAGYPGPKRSHTISTYLGHSAGSSQMFDFATGYLTEPNSRTHLNVTTDGPESSCHSMGRIPGSGAPSNNTFSKKYYTSSTLYRPNNLWPAETSPDMSKRICQRLNNEQSLSPVKSEPSSDQHHHSLHQHHQQQHHHPHPHHSSQHHDLDQQPQHHHNTTKKSITLPNFLSAIEECEDNNNHSPLIPGNSGEGGHSHIGTTNTFKTSAGELTAIRTGLVDGGVPGSQHRLSVTWIDDSDLLHHLAQTNDGNRSQQQQLDDIGVSGLSRSRSNASQPLYKSVDSCLNLMSTPGAQFKEPEYTQLRMLPPTTSATPDKPPDSGAPSNSSDLPAPLSSEYPVTYV